MKDECKNCDLKNIREWIQSNGSRELKFFADIEPCRSADVLDLYEIEKEIFDKK